MPEQNLKSKPAERRRAEAAPMPENEAAQLRLKELIDQGKSANQRVMELKSKLANRSISSEEQAKLNAAAAEAQRELDAVIEQTKAAILVKRQAEEDARYARRQAEQEEEAAISLTSLTKLPEQVRARKQSEAAEEARLAAAEAARAEQEAEEDRLQGIDLTTLTKEDKKAMAEANLSLKDVRNQLANENVAYLKKYGGVTGWLRRMADRAVHAKDSGVRAEAQREYDEARAREIGSVAGKMLEEQTALADAQAEAFAKEKGWGTKAYEQWKKLGKVRIAISAGLVGAAFFAPGGAPVVVGALAARGAMGAIGGAIGSYDMMKKGAEMMADKVKLSGESQKELDRFAADQKLGFWARFTNPEAKAKYNQKTLELQAKEAGNLSMADLDKIIQYHEAVPVLQGQKPSDNPVYMMLMKEKRKRLDSALAGGPELGHLIQQEQGAIADRVTGEVGKYLEMSAEADSAAMTPAKKAEMTRKMEAMYDKLPPSAQLIIEKYRRGTRWQTEQAEMIDELRDALMRDDAVGAEATLAANANADKMEKALGIRFEQMDRIKSAAESYLQSQMAAVDRAREDRMMTAANRETAMKVSAAVMGALLGAGGVYRGLQGVEAALARKEALTKGARVATETLQNPQKMAAMIASTRQEVWSKLAEVKKLSAEAIVKMKEIARLTGTKEITFSPKEGLVVGKGAVRETVAGAIPKGRPGEGVLRELGKLQEPEKLSERVGRTAGGMAKAQARAAERAEEFGVTVPKPAGESIKVSDAELFGRGAGKGIRVGEGYTADLGAKRDVAGAMLAGKAKAEEIAGATRGVSAPVLEETKLAAARGVRKGAGEALEITAPPKAGGVSEDIGSLRPRMPRGYRDVALGERTPGVPGGAERATRVAESVPKVKAEELVSAKAAAAERSAFAGAKVDLGAEPEREPLNIKERIASRMAGRGALGGLRNVPETPASRGGLEVVGPGGVKAGPLDVEMPKVGGESATVSDAELFGRGAGRGIRVGEGYTADLGAKRDVAGAMLAGKAKAEEIAGATRGVTEPVLEESKLAAARGVRRGAGEALDLTAPPKAGGVSEDIGSLRPRMPRGFRNVALGERTPGVPGGAERATRVAEGVPNVKAEELVSAKAAAAERSAFAGAKVDLGAEPERAPLNIKERIASRVAGRGALGGLRDVPETPASRGGLEVVGPSGVKAGPLEVEMPKGGGVSEQVAMGRPAVPSAAREYPRLGIKRDIAGPKLEGQAAVRPAIQEMYAKQLEAQTAAMEGEIAPDKLRSTMPFDVEAPKPVASADIGSLRPRLPQDVRDVSLGARGTMTPRLSSEASVAEMTSPRGAAAARSAFEGARVTPANPADTSLGVVRPEAPEAVVQIGRELPVSTAGVDGRILFEKAGRGLQVKLEGAFGNVPERTLISGGGLTRDWQAVASEKLADNPALAGDIRQRAAQLMTYKDALRQVTAAGDTEKADALKKMILVSRERIESDYGDIIP